jgi:hypothetical protein
VASLLPAAYRTGPRVVNEQDASYLRSTMRQVTRPTSKPSWSWLTYTWESYAPCSRGTRTSRRQRERDLAGNRAAGSAVRPWDVTATCPSRGSLASVANGTRPRRWG